MAKILPFERPKEERYAPVPVNDVHPEGPFIRNLALDTQSGIYYVRKSKKGKPDLFKSTGETSKYKAQKVAESLIAEYLTGKAKARPGKALVSDLCADLLADLEAETKIMTEGGYPQRSAKTFEKDRTFLTRVIPDLFGNQDPSSIDEEWWRTWEQANRGKVKNYKTGQPRKMAEIAKYLSKVLSYAHRKHHIQRLPKLFRGVQTKYKIKAAVYEDDVVLEFLEHAEPILYDLVAIEGENPFRPGEVSGLCWSWIEFDEELDGTPSAIVTLPATTTKTRDERRFPLSANAAAILSRRFAERDTQSPYVFPAPKDPQRPMSNKHRADLWKRMLVRVNAARVKAGKTPYPGTLKFHWLRHSLYTKLIIDKGENLMKVSKAGGTSLATLHRHYVEGDVKRLSSVTKAVSLKLPPRK